MEARRGFRRRRSVHRILPRFRRAGKEIYSAPGNGCLVSKTRQMDCAGPKPCDSSGLTYAHSLDIRGANDKANRDFVSEPVQRGTRQDTDCSLIDPERAGGSRTNRQRKDYERNCRDSEPQHRHGWESPEGHLPQIGYPFDRRVGLSRRGRRPIVTSGLRHALSRTLNKSYISVLMPSTSLSILVRL